MALDINALKKKLDQLNGKRDGNSRSEKMWRPDVGNYVVRILPWKDNEGQPFKERMFYYNIGKSGGILSPHQFGKPDPIQDLINKLRATGKVEDKELCKRLYPKQRAFVPIIVRGEESRGPLLWNLGKILYQDLINTFLDSDYGDITDPNDGWDLKVSVTQVQGKDFKDTKFKVAAKSTKLAETNEKMQEILNSIPNLDELYPLESFEKIKGTVDAWLNAEQNPGEAPSPADEATANASAGASPVPATSQKKGGNKKAELDAAFNDLMSDD
jgi:hypothetical protein